MDAAPIVFAQPALLLGLGLVVLPVLVHLLLRPRPRRTRFPALSLLRDALRGGQRASRIRNVFLMLLRALLLALAALLLAGPTCRPQGGPFVGDEPAACVMVFDDSLSTGYRLDERTTRQDVLRSLAREFILGTAGWPDGSQLALVRTGADRRPGALTRSRDECLEALDRRSDHAVHARPLGSALRAAADLLRQTRLTTRRLVVFTDGAAHAWEDVTPEALLGVPYLAVRVVTPGDDPSTNLALRDAACPAWRHRRTAPVPLRATVAATGLPGRCWLRVGLSEQTLRREGPLELPADAVREVRFELPPVSAPLAAFTLELEPPDRLDFDQRRFVALQTVPPPTVWLVGPEEDPERDLTGLLLRNLLAPEALDPEQQLVRLDRFAATALPAHLNASADSADAEQPVLVVLLSGYTLDPKTLEALLRRVDQGMTMVLVPGTFGTAPDWPLVRARFSSFPPEVETLDALTSLRWEPGSSYDGDRALAEWTRCAVRRRLRLNGTNPEATVLARYADDEPALLLVRQGAGRLFLLTTSPDPSWSDLGVRAAGLLTWLHRLIDEGLGHAEAVADFSLGASAREPFPGLPRLGLARVVRRAGREEEPQWVRLIDGRPTPGWPTDQPGVYEVYDGDGRLRAVYTVNVPAWESDLTPIRHEEVKRRLGVRQAEFQGGREEAAGPRNGIWPQWLVRQDVRIPLAGLLLSLFYLELFLASHRRKPRVPEPKSEAP